MFKRVLVTDGFRNCVALHTCIASKVTKQKWRRRREVRSLGKCTSRTCRLDALSAWLKISEGTCRPDGCRLPKRLPAGTRYTTIWYTFGPLEDCTALKSTCAFAVLGSCAYDADADLLGRNYRPCCTLGLHCHMAIDTHFIQFLQPSHGMSAKPTAPQRLKWSRTMATVTRSGTPPT